jgi:O-antigen/teichoic acid export membrane protein
MNNKLSRIKEIISSLKDLATVGIVDIAGSGIGAIFWFYVASVLSAGQYGQISYFIAIGGMASSIALLGTENTLTVYTAKNVKLQSTVYLLGIISAFISSVVVFFLFYKFELSLLIFGYVLVGLAISEMFGRKSYFLYSKYFVIHKILTVGLGIGLYYLMGETGLILGIALACYIYVIRIYQGFRDSRIDFSLVKTRSGFMITSYMTNLSDRFSGSIDKLIIAPMLGFVILGNYQLGIQVLDVMQILPSIVYKYILPHDASGNPNKRLKKMTILCSIGVAALGVIISPLLIPVMFPKYTEAVQVIQILSLSMVPTTVSLMYASKFLGIEKNKIILFGSLLFLSVQIVAIVTLGQTYGANGAAMGFVIAVTCQTILYLVADRFLKQNKVN